MRTRVSPFNAASVFTIAVLASPVAAGQENAASLEFQGVASAELLEAFKMPHADSLYEDFWIPVIPANDSGVRSGEGIGSVLFPIKLTSDLIGVDTATLRLRDRHSQWAPSFISQTKIAVDADAIDYRSGSAGP